MAIATSCCFKLSSSGPPTRSSSTPPTRAQQQVSARPKREISWRNQCVVRMACAIVSLQVECLIPINDYAIAANPEAVVESKGKVKRWSDKRICPPWQLNSLETIVPENLPRPSFKRRWESVGDHHSKVAPPLKASTTTTTSSPNCFSM